MLSRREFGHEGLTSRQITGIVVGVVAALFILAALTICCCFSRPGRRRRDDYIPDTDSEIGGQYGGPPQPVERQGGFFGLKSMGGKKDRHGKGIAKGVVYGGRKDNSTGDRAVERPPAVYRG